MCTRFVLEQDRLRALIAALDPASLAQLAATTNATRYNIAPGTSLLALRSVAARSTGDVARTPASNAIFNPRWGLIPSWARDATRPSVNARAESLAERPAFRDAFRHRRCVVPASAFYEWEARGRSRHPWLFRRRDGQAFFFAALWEIWPALDCAPLETCALVTTAANPTVAPIHDRMPALLDTQAAHLWLDPATPPAALGALLQPAADDLLASTELIRRINHLEHDDPACLTPASAAPPDDQFTLGL